MPMPGWLGKLLNPFEQADDNDLQDYPNPAPPEPMPVVRPSAPQYSTAVAGRSAGFNGGYNESSSAVRGYQIKRTHATVQLSIATIKPERFDNKLAGEIGEHMKARRTVVLNLQDVREEHKQRLIDFLSGVAFAMEGTVKKVSPDTYMYTPAGVDVIGDLVEDLDGGEDLYYSTDTREG